MVNDHDNNEVVKVDNNDTHDNDNEDEIYYLITSTNVDDDDHDDNDNIIDDNNNNNCSIMITSQQSIPPLFNKTLHIKYIKHLMIQYDSNDSYEGAITEHLRMSGVYWTMTTLYLIALKQNGNDSIITNDMINWIYTCYDHNTGGFGGNTNQDGHLLYTLSAIQLLALNGIDFNHDERFLTIKSNIIDFVCSLQNNNDGSFSGDIYGEIDTRFTYCAVSILSILNSLNKIDSIITSQYIIKCYNIDGSFGSTIGSESHAGQVFCCIGTLSILKTLYLLLQIDTNCSLLGWWLCERQCDSGGFNGRSEKQADVCYSWWILSILCIINKISWISKKSLGIFILNCQDNTDGGIADRPNDMPDIFHTFFGICGLSLLNYLHNTNTTNDATANNNHNTANNNNNNNQNNLSCFQYIDPIYALPTNIVQKLKLQGQVLCSKDNIDTLDPRLSHYDVIYID